MVFHLRGVHLTPSLSIFSFVLGSREENLKPELAVRLESCEVPDSWMSTGDWRVVLPHVTGNNVFHSFGPAIRS